VAGNVQANLDEHVRLADLAAAEGAVVVFPELSLIGYELALARELAFSESDPRLYPLLDVAAYGPRIRALFPCMSVWATPWRNGSAWASSYREAVAGKHP
jgi:predicted amidohydrolase